jgi:hypothetical protein
MVRTPNSQRWQLHTIDKPDEKTGVCPSVPMNEIQMLSDIKFCKHVNAVLHDLHYT